MRRHEKEITDHDLIEAILKEERVCRIAFCDMEKPYLVPMIFGYQGAIYISIRPGKGKRSI